MGGAFASPRVGAALCRFSFCLTMDTCSRITQTLCPATYEQTRTQPCAPFIRPAPGFIPTQYRRDTDVLQCGKISKTRRLTFVAYSRLLTEIYWAFPGARTSVAVGSLMIPGNSAITIAAISRISAINRMANPKGESSLCDLSTFKR